MNPTASYRVTPEQFAAYRAALPSEGFTDAPRAVTADAPANSAAGQVTGKGVTVGYAYDGVGVLTLEGIAKTGFAGWYSWTGIFNLIATTSHLQPATV